REAARVRHCESRRGGDAGEVRPGQRRGGATGPRRARRRSTGDPHEPRDTRLRARLPPGRDRRRGEGTPKVRLGASAHQPGPGGPKMQSSDTTAQGATRGFLQVDGHRVSYLEWGDEQRPTVILLHGVIGNALSLEWLGVAIGASHHVIAMDAICRGHSDWIDMPWPALTAPDVDGTRIGHGVAAVRALIDDRGLDDVVLVGLSTGGVVAGLCAAYHLDRLRGVSIDDGPYARTEANLGTTQEARERAVDDHECASLEETLHSTPT